MESEDEHKSAGYESMFRRKRKGSEVDNESENQLKKPRSDSIDDIENGIESKPDTNEIKAVSHEQKEANAEPDSSEQKKAHAEPVSNEQKEVHVEPVSNEQKEAHAESVSNEQKEAHAELVSNEQKEARSVDLHSTCSTEESKEVMKYIPIGSCNDIGIFAELDNPISCNVNENDKIVDNPQKEDIAAHEITVEQSCETSQPGTCQAISATEKDEYVYRLLRFKESYSQGLHPKNINSRITLQEHVENGSSEGHASRFISCCKTLGGLRELGGITNNFGYARKVVRINITKLNSRGVTVIDLTDENIRQRHIDRDSSAWGYANRFEEVILQPYSYVPADCVERIGIVQYRNFIKDKHIDL